MRHPAGHHVAQLNVGQLWHHLDDPRTAGFTDNADRASRPLHDPCVMLMALLPHLFGTQAMRIAVDCDTHMGRLVSSPDGAPVDVALSVDAPGALDALWRGLAGVDQPASSISTSLVQKAMPGTMAASLKS